MSIQQLTISSILIAAVDSLPFIFAIKLKAMQQQKQQNEGSFMAVEKSTGMKLIF